MRMNRFDWLARFFQPIFSGPVKARKPPSPPPKGPAWLVAVPGVRPFRVNGITKSEARARAKTHLGIGRKDRLPVHSLVTKGK